MVEIVPTNNALTSSNTSSSDESLTGLAEDFDDFLNLLIVQLQNQDPLEPLETNEFTDQLVAFSQVEQQINSNKHLEELIDATNLARNADIVSFVGHEVEVQGELVTLEEGSDVKLAYNIEGDTPDEVFVTIEDLDGNIVFNGTGTTNPGRNTVSWQGLDNDENSAEPGLYHVRVSRKDGEAIEEIDSFVTGRVLGTSLSGTEPKLVVNGQEIALGDVRFVGTNEPENNNS